MKRIYVDARNLTATPSGVGRYAECLIPELVRQGRGRYRWVVVRHASNRRPMPWTGEADVAEVFLASEIGSARDFGLGAAALRQVVAQHGAPDLYHSLFHVIPLGLGTVVAPRPRIVVTLHDLIWIDHPIQSQTSLGAALTIHLFARIAIRATVRAADMVICVSEATRLAAERRFGKFRNTCVGHGVHDRYFQRHPPPDGELGEWVARSTPYVVAVGNAKRYKNLQTLVGAFRASPFLRDRAKLVLVGPEAPLRELLRREGAGDEARATGFLDEEAFVRTLAHASAFVFPSTVEGYGLPPLEAMALGVPALVADVEPMRSICGSGATYFPPHGVSELATELGRWLTDRSLREEATRRGSAHVASLRWPSVASATLDAYERTLCEHPTR